MEKEKIKENKEETKPYSDSIKKFRQELLIAGYSKRTLESYCSVMDKFFGYTQKNPKEVERDDIIGFMAHLKEDSNSSNATLALNLSAIKFFFHNFVKRKVVEDIRHPKKARKLPTFLTKEEVKALIKAAKFGRDRCIIEFLYSSGVRVSECVNMKIDDLDIKEGVARVKGGKGDKDRVIILSKEWIKEFKKYQKRRKIASEYVFSKKNGKPISSDTVQRLLRKAREKSGITKKVTPHVLRHTYSTHLLESGENIRKIQELLGHSNLSTTQIYTHISTSELKKVKSPLDNL